MASVIHKENQERILTWALPSLILLAVLAAYFRSLAIPLIADDYVAATDLSTWWGWSSNYFFRPVSRLWFDLLRPLFGFHPAGYHLLNILIHAVNALLAYFIGLRLWSLGSRGQTESRPAQGRLVAAALALAFALSYSLSEAVFWIVGITSLLEAFFILAITLLTLRYLDPKGKKPLPLLASLLLFVVGLGVKEGCLLVVGIVPLLHLIHEGRLRPKRTLLAWVPFLLIAALYLLSVPQAAAMRRDPVYAYHLGFPLFRNLQQFTLSALFWTPFKDASISGLQHRLWQLALPAKVPIDAWLVLAILGYALVLLMLVAGGLRSRLAFLILLGVMLPYSLPALPLCGWFRYPYPFRTYYLPVLFFAFFLLLTLARTAIGVKRRWLVPVACGLLAAAALVNAGRVWKRTDDWIAVGRKYNFVLDKLNKRLADVHTPRLQIRVVDPESDGTRTYNRGIFTLYHNGLFPLMQKLGILRENVREERLPSAEDADRLTEEEGADIRTGRLTVVLYSDRQARRLSPD